MKKSVIAISRCEVGGEVYLPNDPMSVTQEQYDFLKARNAIRDAKANETPTLARAPAKPALEASQEAPSGAAADSEGSGSPEGDSADSEADSEADEGSSASGRRSKRFRSE